MIFLWIFGTFLINQIYLSSANDVLGCGGFIKSHVPIDFSKIEVKLVTKQGIIKDRTTCAPNNGYYFVPLYDKGELILELSPPPGWSFTPKQINLNIDGSDPCSQGKDINFVFKGFGITGKVETLGSPSQGGAQGVTVILTSKDKQRTTQSDKNGNFFFSPVFPGKYTVSASHKKWKLYKNSVQVEVAEGNTELTPNSLVLQGYDVKGQILTDDGHPVKNTVLALFSQTNNNKILVDGCNKDKIVNIPETYLCYVTSNSVGEFVFPVVPYGKYFVAPYYKENNIYFHPEKIEFSVEYSSVKLDENFKVVGFSIPGRVTNGKNKPISNAKIYLNGKEVTSTDASGNYKLEKLKGGQYSLKAEAGDYQFNEVNLNININLASLPDLVPFAYKVCGKVLSDNPQKVIFTQTNSAQVIKTVTNSQQEFCEYLTPGEYQVQVDVPKSDKESGIQFFPFSQKIVVSSENILDLIFSQLKSTISGQVNCIQNKDCDGLSVILKSGLDEVTVPVQNSHYSVSDMFPGSYEVSLVPNKFCWKTNKQTININSVKANIPPFVQAGYIVNFVSSHEAKATYKTLKQGQHTEFDIQRGVTSICLEAPGQYVFSLKSCHNFDNDAVTYNTSSDENQLTLKALKHMVTVAIESLANYGPIEVGVKIQEEAMTKTDQNIVSFSSNKYEIQLMLKPSEVATVTPKSDLLIFSPPSLQIEGANDCQHLGNKFTAVKGKVYRGQVQPPLAGVAISVENIKTGQMYLTQTDEKGFFRLPPLDYTFDYKIIAKKDSYIITGPDNNGNFIAQKLAEVVVEVLDEADNSPLAGVLLSLSGGESYRKNSQTATNGKITFYSLSASDYFLRPMMKEYQFEPSSKMIRVEEGQTVRVRLMGKRVAFSAFGKVTSVNDEAVENVNVLASGTGNCTSYSEETTTDADGTFRIRGLQPYCSFRVSIQVGTDSADLIERTSPEFIEIENIDQDIENLHIIVFRPVLITDVLLRVFAPNFDHYKTLSVKVYREAETQSLFYSSVVDYSKLVDRTRNQGLFVQIPSIPLDKILYSIHLESSPNMKVRPQVVYFNANTTFRYIEMEFSVNTNNNEPPIKQSSIWAVLFFLIVLACAYNIQFIVDLLREYVNINFSSLSKYIPNSSRKLSDNYDNEIDQIVHDINNMRKNRFKKVQ